MAQIESVIEPNGIADDVWRKPVALVGIHRQVIEYGDLACQYPSHSERTANTISSILAIRKRDAYAAGAIATVLIGCQALAILYGTIDQMHFVYLVILLWHTASAVAMFSSLLIRVIPKVSK